MVKRKKRTRATVKRKSKSSESNFGNYLMVIFGGALVFLASGSFYGIFFGCIICAIGLYNLARPSHLK